jgi:uncharacterized membrane protein YbhN (UPF0104 family)
MPGGADGSPSSIGHQNVTMRPGVAAAGPRGYPLLSGAPHASAQCVRNDHVRMQCEASDASSHLRMCERATDRGLCRAGSMGKRWWSRPEVSVLFLIVAFASLGWALVGQWSEIRAVGAGAFVGKRFAWPWVVLGSLLVLATHAILVQSWRLLLRGCGGALPFGRAVSIWTIASLGKWIPGKFWQIGAMGSLAGRHGVSPMAATGAAVLGTLINVGTGFCIASVTGAAALDAIRPRLALYARAAAIAFFIGLLALPAVLPQLRDQLARWGRIPTVALHLTARDVLLAALMNAASWIGYGLAFACFVRGVAPEVSGDLTFFVALYSASYLVGFLILFSPGGLGFREAALVALLVGTGTSGPGEATILSLFSRVWLTLLEVLPGVASLLLLSSVNGVALRRRN